MSTIETTEAITLDHRESETSKSEALLEEAFSLQWGIFRKILTTGMSSLLNCDFATLAQFKAFLALADAEPMVIGQVSQRLGVGISNAGQLIDKLVQAGLVERVGDSGDRRRIYARLTPQGLATYEERVLGSRGKARELLSSLAEEDLAALVQGLRALKCAIDKRT